VIPRHVVLILCALAAGLGVAAFLWQRPDTQIEHRLIGAPTIAPLRRASAGEFAGLIANRFCRHYRVYSQAGFDLYGFPTHDSHDCTLFEEGGLIMAKLQSSSRFGSMPVLLVAAAAQSRTSPITVVLVGGPQDTVFPGLKNDQVVLLQALARQTGGTILVPGYYGTGHRSVYPQADLDFAGRELRPWIDRLQEDWPGREVSIVGFSSGALLAFDLFQERPVPTTLVSAPAVSIEELYRLWKVRFLYGTRAQRAERGGTIAFEMRGDRMVLVDLREAPLADIHRAFFGRHYSQPSWTAELPRLPPQRRSCLHVVFGAEDDTIARPAFFSQGLDMVVRTTMVPGVGHMSRSEAQAAALATAITPPPSCE